MTSWLFGVDLTAVGTCRVRSRYTTSLVRPLGLNRSSNRNLRNLRIFIYQWFRLDLAVARPLGRVYLMGRLLGSIFVTPVPFLSSRI